MPGGGGGRQPQCRSLNLGIYDFRNLSIFNLTARDGLAIMDGVNVRFKDKRLDRLFHEASDGDYHPRIVDAFRRRVNQIKAAQDERLFYSQKGLHFEKLEGSRAHQRSVRLNDQTRLIMELEGKGPDKTVWIISIEDYH